MSDTMAPQELMDLLQDWIAGNVPGEVLCDGMIDAGMDPEFSPWVIDKSYRDHFCKPLCSSSESLRRKCTAGEALMVILRGKGAKP